FNDDPNYPAFGEGFQGAGTLEIEKTGLSVEAVTQFGRVNDYEYFYVDGLLNFGNLAKASGPFQLQGFGGGVAYKMAIGDVDVDLFANSEPNPSTLIPGQTLTATSYVPDANVLLSFKATVLFSVGDENLVTGTLSMLMEFNDDLGLNEIRYSGTALLLNDNITELAALTPSTNVAGMTGLTAFVDLGFDFKNSTLSGTLVAFLNAGPITGSGTQGKLVDARLHVSPEKWYLYIGTPEEENRAGVKIDIGDVVDVQARMYLDIGTEVPSFPDLPANLRSLLPQIRTNEDLRQSGAGFAFGADLMVDVNVGIIGIVQATLEAGVGFDVMLKKYNNLYCGPEPAGINGWYASGQMWAYINGELKVFGLPIFQTGLATVLQARMPNPFWAQASVAVRIRLGFVKFEQNMSIELGDNCDLNNDDFNNPLGMSIVSYFSPADEAVEIETNIQPEAYLTMSLNKNYKIDNQNFIARLSEDDHQMFTTEDQIPIEHEVVISNQKITFVPKEFLPPNENITAKLHIKVFKNGDFFNEEEAITTFTTGSSLNYIPVSNIKAAYPSDGMVNFYPEEDIQKDAFIELISGQPDLLYNVPSDYQQKIRLISASGDEELIDYTYNPINNRLDFSLANLNNDEKLYRLEIVRLGNLPKDVSIGENSAYNAVSNPSYDLEPEVGGELADEPLPDNVLYRIHFRTSKYPTFRAKLSDIITGLSGDEIEFDQNGSELFDQLELNAGEHPDLVDFRVAEYSVNDWLEQVSGIYQLLESDVSTSPCRNLAPEFNRTLHLGLAGIDYGILPRPVTLSDFEKNAYNIFPRLKQKITANMQVEADKIFQELKTGLLGCIAEDDLGQIQSAQNKTGRSVQVELIDKVRNAKINISPTSVKLNATYYLPNGQVSTPMVISF
ncbi:MAG: hypothetical protein KDC80_21560, partial [Saprospiraceae bacterium]|nr:hypothetical protein [Saprospiraceae bacterium]